MVLSKPEIKKIIKRDKDHYCGDKYDEICVKIVAVADMPSRFGTFQIVAFTNNQEDKDHIALVHGDVCNKNEVPVRLHSECLTGDAIGSLRCDCRDQLITSMKTIASMDAGVILYLRQEGRGIGLMNKMKAYQLQDFGMDTVDANRALGFRDDERDYGIAAHMLKSLDIKSIRLMTNNPKKIEGLTHYGIEVKGRIPILIKPTQQDKEYLKTKMERSGHMLDDLFVENG